MAIGIGSTLDVSKDTGNDLWGAGFNPYGTGAGTDYSRGSSPILSVSDLAYSGSGLNVTSVTGGFTSALRRNFGYLPAVTNGTPGRYEITAVVDGNTLTLDRAPGTGAFTGGTFNIGGSAATLASVLLDAHIGAIVTLRKAATAYALTAALTAIPGSGGDPRSYSGIFGYNATPGDLDGVASRANFPMIQAQGAFPTTGFMVTLGSGYNALQNVVLDGNSIAQDGTGGAAVNSRVKNCSIFGVTRNAVRITGGFHVDDCDLSGAQGGMNLTLTGTPIGGIRSTRVIGGAGPGIFLSSAIAGTTVMDRVVIAGQTGSTGHGIQCASSTTAVLLFNSVIASVAGDGINAASYLDALAIEGTIFANITGTNQMVRCVNGGAYRNANFFRNGLFNVANRGAILAAGPGEVAFGADPFVNAAGYDFTLNGNTPGGGQARGKGLPAFAPGATGTAQNIDMGAYQSAAGGGSSIYHPLGGGIIR